MPFLFAMAFVICHIEPVNRQPPGSYSPYWECIKALLYEGNNSKVRINPSGKTFSFSFIVLIVRHIKTIMKEWRIFFEKLLSYGLLSELRLFDKIPTFFRRLPTPSEIAAYPFLTAAYSFANGCLPIWKVLPWLMTFIFFQRQTTLNSLNLYLPYLGLLF